MESLRVGVNPSRREEQVSYLSWKMSIRHKEAVKKFGEEPLTGAAEQRRVLGQLVWAALSLFFNFIFVTFSGKTETFG